MARTNLEGARIKDCIIHDGNRYGILTQGATTSITIGPDAPHVLVITPTNATNVLLPANPTKGDFYMIVNAAGSALALTIQNSAGAAITPATAPAQNKTAWVVFDGTVWRGTLSA